MTEWSDMVKPIVAKCEVGAAFGQRVVFNRDGADALGKLLKEMASKLDEANDRLALPEWITKA
jgi:hypothetical protein